MTRSSTVSTTVALAALTLTVLACQRDPSTGPVEISASAAAPITVAASGSGHVMWVAGPVTARRTFAFTARKYADGSASGQVQVHNRANDNGLHGEIVCMGNIGDGILGLGARVRTYGTYTEGLIPNLSGDYALFAVRDNGESAGSPPDQFTGVDITGVVPNGPNLALLACANPGALGITPALIESIFLGVESGNIQVRW